ncbi:CinA-related molybdopterin-binding protein [Thermococcus kodakarensis KOD1]|uniref:Protein TK1472 n=1 Tax=Thermococcus kodakarensis (strain ATCC BAA-918 / JCM 12380 / KOD1) TaxID=69014 RepID=Y1472_THEKO|nr:molybdopterin-binding protein [Thermococcus kodakarensis]Q5JJB4.1 RecName: Full=Protein TK1472 [Thermococcus kodakarensis KOD1]WCN27437.1 molybdopterin-binding protein [Thermococcus kodakarensis]WCN29727.1 molybdopterin-binding protein [Thermococcus kodakarensis]BAD85661.1 CinA-related molybdopterin-binding protein [Thermococcus kodakarensis KOD1]
MFAEVLTIGDELLTGHTVDSNSAFIASKLTEQGYWVRRITTVGDDVEEIKAVVGEILARKPEVLVISGGLGPTHDDVTMLAVAEALGRKLVLCEKCLERIKAFYEKLYSEGYIDDPSLNEGRKKMAYLPEGAEPLENTGGAAPGAFIEHKGVKIFVLPGMPREMKAMLEKEVLPRLGRRKFLQRKFLAEITDESKLAPILREALERFNVRIHSSPKGFGKYIGLIIFAEDEGELEKTVEYLESRGIRLEEA